MIISERDKFKLKTNLDYLLEIIDSNDDAEILRVFDITQVMLSNILAANAVNNIHYAKNVTRYQLTDFETIALNTPFLINEFDSNVYVKKRVGKNYYITNVNTGISTLASKKINSCAVLKIMEV